MRARRERSCRRSRTAPSTGPRPACSALPEAVDARASGLRSSGWPRSRRAATESSTSRNRSTRLHRLLVVRAEVVVDQRQHLLAREGVVVAAQLLDVLDAVVVDQRARASRRWPGSAGSGGARRRVRPRCGSRFTTSWRFCSSCRCSERRKLAGSRKIAMMRASGWTSAIRPRGDRRPQVGGGGLADALPGARMLEQPQVVLEAFRPTLRPVNSIERTSSSCTRGLLAGEVPRLLAGAGFVLRHADLRVLAQHLVQRRRAALGVPDDEEVRDAQRGAYGRRGGLGRRAHRGRSLTRLRRGSAAL